MPGFVDFKALAESIDVFDVADMLGLTLKHGKDIRGCCPACNGDERSIQIFPETNTFRCYKAAQSGDVIALYAHVKGLAMYKSAKELSEHTSAPKREEPAHPQAGRREANRAPTKKKNVEQVFDAEAFASKLTYADEVAQSLLIGEYKGRTYHGHRYSSGVIAGYSYLLDGQLVPPKQWLPDTASNVVKLKRA